MDFCDAILFYFTIIDRSNGRNKIWKKNNFFLTGDIKVYENVGFIFKSQLFFISLIDSHKQNKVCLKNLKFLQDFKYNSII